MLRYFMIFNLFLISVIPGVSQHSVYEGKSMWSMIPGATEKFSYETSDSLKIPNNWYTMKSIHEGNVDGSYELLLINAEMKKGVPNGQATFYHYNMRFIINDFDEKGVDASTMGERTLIRGQYENGIITDIWSFQYGKLEDSSSWNTLYYDTHSQEWTFNLDSLHYFSGHTESSGVFTGNWNWQAGSDKIKYSYHKGVLTGIQNDEVPVFTEVFEHENQLLQLTDSLVSVDTSHSFIWSSGKENDDPVSNHQLVFSELMDKAFRPIYLVRKDIQSHPFFKLPKITGTTKLFHPLEEEYELMLQMVLDHSYERAAAIDNQLEQPIFLLRRSAQPALDSLFFTAEKIKSQAADLRKETDWFLSAPARVVSPYKMIKDSSEIFRNHQEVLQYFLQKDEELNSMTEELYVGLDEMRSFLQLTGALEELEEQWYYLLEEIREEAQKSKATLYASQILDNWVEEEFIFRNEIYIAEPSLTERRNFLLETLDYFQWYKRFFKERELDTLIFAEGYFSESFTQYWYNPYMGEHNVEVVVRKKFLQNIISNFWPYVIESLMQARNGYEFMELQDKFLKYRKWLGMFPDDKSSAAKRLDSRGKKESDMKKLEALIEEYMEVIEEF